MTEHELIKCAVMAILCFMGGCRAAMAADHDKWLAKNPTNPDWNEKWVY